MPQIGPLEIVMVLVVALLVFGPKKLPEVGKQAAKGLREFRRFQSGIRDDLQGMLDVDATPSPSGSGHQALDSSDDDADDDADDDGTSVSEAPAESEPSPPVSEASPAAEAPPPDQTP
jgi:TatA/E family protein of Tat protein translocase